MTEPSSRHLPDVTFWMSQSLPPFAVAYRDFIQSIVRETARYSLKQAELSTIAYRDVVSARDIAAIASAEIKFIEQSYQLALESGERMKAISARQDDERLSALPIE